MSNVVFVPCIVLFPFFSMTDAVATRKRLLLYSPDTLLEPAQLLSRDEEDRNSLSKMIRCITEMM